MDKVFKALADATRRKLLDRLKANNGQTLGELCVRMNMTRQAVAKHLGLLEDANLVAVVWQGRNKLHYLNPVPIHEVYERWIGKYEQHRLSALHNLKKLWRRKPMEKPKFVYVTYITTTPEKLWNALLNSEMTRQYWGNRTNASDWKPGSRWEHRDVDDAKLVDIVGKVVESDPPRKLVLSWADPKEEGRPEAYSRVTLELVQFGELVRLTVTHEDFEVGSNMLTNISYGWPVVLSSLKTLLETGKPMPMTSNRKGWPPKG